MSAATLSLRLTPSTKGKCATGLIGCIVIAMRHPFCKLDERLHHSGYPRDDIGLKPACAKNPPTRPLPLEPGENDTIGLLISTSPTCCSQEMHRGTGLHADEYAAGTVLAGGDPA